MNNVLQFPARPGYDEARLQKLKTRIHQIFDECREPELQALRQRVERLERALEVRGGAA